MNIVLYPLMLLAGIGFVLSAAAHVIAWMGMDLPGGSLIWTLHVGIFMVWIPTVLVCIKTTRYADRNDFWKVALSGCPPWMRRALYVLFVYAVCNFILQILTTSHGRQTMGDAPPSVIRGFSGHWMVFYATAFAVLYSAIHAPHLFHPRRCPNGHPVGPAVRFCPQCGYAFPDAPALETAEPDKIR
jgi:hypothetical protein